MKKFKIVLFSLGIILFTACSSDDSNNEESKCYDCSLELLGQAIDSEYCDNGDGTLDVTTQGVTETVDLEGTTFDSFISQVEIISACTKQ